MILMWIQQQRELGGYMIDMNE